MAETAATIDTLVGSYTVAGKPLTWRTFDSTNGMTFVPTGRETVLFQNLNASVRTVVVVSVADPFLRTGNLTDTLSQNQITAFGPIQKTGFLDTGDGKVSLTSTGVDTKYLILQTP